MASFLNIGLLNFFSIIFPMLLVFFIVFALLEKTKILGEKKTIINAIVGICAAFIVLMLKDIILIIQFMIPWFVIVFIALILLLMLFKIMGATDESIAGFFSENKTIPYVLVGIGIIILIASISHVYGERLLPLTSEREISETSAIEAGESSFKQNVFSVLFSPLVLGTLFILILAVFSIALLTKERL